MPHQRRQIGTMAVECMGLLTNRLLRETKADHVRNDHPPSGPDERTNDIAVQKSPCRVTVQEYNRITLALVDVVHSPAIDARKARRIRPLLAKRGGQHIVSLDCHHSSGNVIWRFSCAASLETK